MNPSRRALNPGFRLDRDGPVATVTLCRPSVRASLGPVSAFGQLVRQLPGEVRILVVTGDQNAFSALSPEVDDPLQLSPVELERSLEAGQAALDWLRQPDLLSLAVVRGRAAGPGLPLALACDLRILTEDAELAVSEVGAGQVPGLGLTDRLVELIGYSRALECAVTGRWIAAAEADRLGLANLVVPAGELDNAVDRFIARLLAAPRDAVVETKGLLLGATARTARERLAVERAAQLRRLRELAGLGE